MSHKKQPWFPPPALPCTGVESHAHLIHRNFAQDLEEVIQRAKDAGVREFGQLFLSPGDWERNKHRFDAHPYVFFLMGLHPSDVHTHDESALDFVRDVLANEPRMKAVGEIGLDYYWKEAPPDLQKRLFVQQLGIARELRLPVVLHCREAEEDTFAILEAEGMTGRPLLWHCFGGDTAMALRIADKGWHLSIPGPVTYPANTALREAVAAAPADRLLVETDCPYLSPVPMRGKRNEPAFLGYTIAAMAEARNMPAEELWTLCGDNARRFFGL